MLASPEQPNEATRQAEPEPTLPVPLHSDSFGFPYQPYTIQEDFMKNLYNALEQRQVGIFESPTGTGKTLSIICGSLKWLNDHSQRLDIAKETLQSQLIQQNTSGEPDWVILQELDARIKQQRQILDDQRAKQLRRREKVKKWNRDRRSKRNRTIPSVTSLKDSEAEDSEHLVAPYESEGETDSVVGIIGEDGYSGSVRKLLQQLETTKGKKQRPCGSYDDSSDDEDIGSPVTKLSQMVHEIRKTGYSEQIKSTSLGSRKTLCINDAVRSLSSIQRVNETCLDMQKKSTSGNHKCPYFPSDKQQLTDFQDHSMSQIHDIEDMVKIGKDLGTCPYYGTRSSIAEAQMVTLPYNLLLQKSAREALGIDPHNNIVIIDEAHNLVDTITQIHSIIINLDQVNRAYSQLSSYFQKYKNRLKGSNVSYVKQILLLLTALRKYLNSGGHGKIALDSMSSMDRGEETGSHLIKPNDLLHELKIDNINLFKIQKYMKLSEISKKLNGFVEKQQQQHAKVGGTSTIPSKQLPSLQSDEAEEWTSQKSTLPLIESFLMTLTNADQDGRVILDMIPAQNAQSLPQPSLKYVLLNPQESFRDIVNEARSVVLAGGTMEPVTELLDLLFSYLPPTQIHRFSCGHIIPPSSLLALSVNQGPTGRPFNFLAQSRKNTALTDELGKALLNLCNVIPHGVVCFFPSYAYLDQVYQHWSQTGHLAKLDRKKQVFREPRSGEGNAEGVLAEYSQAARHTLPPTGTNSSGPPGPPLPFRTGALLLSVVGGKMSEGINFGDDLGRGIVMVGLPFANLGSRELQEKIRFVGESARRVPVTSATTVGEESGDLPATKREGSGGPSSDASSRSSELPSASTNGGPVDIRTVLQSSEAQTYYENLCMKAVNQSIGRAIRHRNDYAVIVLLDERYSTSRISRKLPGWIEQRRTQCDRFGPVVGKIAGFFREKSANAKSGGIF
ncbi:ATP-dependent DNA helicase chl1 [Dimargaris cristalligena]|nr:ATP-dependent DNA helicase chl1 [Dimargaris cristalligena]